MLKGYVIFSAEMAYTSEGVKASRLIFLTINSSIIAECLIQAVQH